MVAGLTRETDVFARLGGDEFALLLPNTDQEGARIVMQKMEKVIADGVEVVAPPLTFSMGVVTFHSAPPSVDHMLQKADEFMYESKKLGKNRVTYGLED